MRVQNYWLQSPGWYFRSAGRGWVIQHTVTMGPHCLQSLNKNTLEQSQYSTATRVSPSFKSETGHQPTDRANNWSKHQSNQHHYQRAFSFKGYEVIWHPCEFGLQTYSPEIMLLPHLHKRHKEIIRKQQGKGPFQQRQEYNQNPATAAFPILSKSLKPHQQKPPASPLLSPSGKSSSLPAWTSSSTNCPWPPL